MISLAVIKERKKQTHTAVSMTRTVVQQRISYLVPSQVNHTMGIWVCPDGVSRHDQGDH